MLVFQGTQDDAVPLSWSQVFVKTISKTNTDASLKIIPGADHNMNPEWNQVVEQTTQYFKSKLN
jgi:alpha-beta hydrolase superfamily lysophospholipase